MKISVVNPLQKPIQNKQHIIPIIQSRRIFTITIQICQLKKVWGDHLSDVRIVAAPKNRQRNNISGEEDTEFKANRMMI